MPGKKKQNGSHTTNGAHDNPTDGFEVLQSEHKKLKELTAKLSASATPASADDDGRRQIMRELCADWNRLTEVDEELVFPAFEEAGTDEAAVRQAQVDADVVTVLLADLSRRAPSDPFFAAVLNSVQARMTELIESKEKDKSGLFARARKAGVDAKELAETLRKTLGSGASEAEVAAPSPGPRHLRGWGPSRRGKEYEAMRPDERHRDDRGRYMEDDDHGRRSSGMRGFQSSRYDDDHDESRYGRASGRRSDDDDDRRGWHGDSRGHSEAARRGWEERRSSHGYDDDDDRRGSGSYRSRGSEDDDRRSVRDQGQGGWFGESERHSEASRRGWDNPQHGESGWFGDSERHAQASRRGWDNPDHRRSGWFGDPEGHSEASRRGWEERGRSSRHDDDDDHDRRRR